MGGVNGWGMEAESQRRRGGWGGARGTIGGEGGSQRVSMEPERGVEEGKAVHPPAVERTRPVSDFGGGNDDRQRGAARGGEEEE